MAILEKEVWMFVNGRTAKYYEQKGYNVPKYINIKKKLVYKTGSKISVKVEDLLSSDVKVTKICDDCGKQMSNIRYADILKARKDGDGKDRCMKCGFVNAGKNKKKKTPYENSFEFNAKKNNMEYLLSEFSNKNVRKPSEIAYKSNDEFIWECPDCKSEYQMVLHHRVGLKQNCPYCRGRRVNHTNCLWATHPKAAKLLKDKQRGYEITAGQNHKECFICEDCGHEQSKVVQSVVIYGLSCSRCSDGIKFPEKFVMGVLNAINIKYETQKKFKWSLNKKYDFYISSLNCIVETHGGQHYGKGFSNLGGRSLEEEKENDRIKEALARENGIQNYIVVNCSESEPDFIKNNIIKSDISSLFDLKLVDWVKCHEFACNSLVKTISELWNSGINNNVEIGKLLNISRTTVYRYLKQGSCLGWCEYDPAESRKRQVAKKLSKKVVQLSIEGQHIKTWNSILTAKEELNIGSSGISAVCRGKRKKTGGFKWMYLEDYNMLLQTDQTV